MKRLSFFLSSILMLTGFACSPFLVFSKAETTPVEVVSETQLPGIIETRVTSVPSGTSVPGPAFEATIYQDKNAGFEFDYPAGWSFDSGEGLSRGYYVQFFSWDWKPGNPIDPMPEGGTVLTVTVQFWDPKNDLEAFISQRKMAWDASGTSILSEERITLAGDQPAAEFIVQGPEGTRAFIMMRTNGENYLVLSGNGNLNLLAEIARTLRPIQ